MFDQLIEKIKKDKTKWAKFTQNFVEREISSKTILLSEGEIANQLYFIKKGCLRIWFNKDGKDITFQFFFEGGAVASIDSFLSNKSSMFTDLSGNTSILRLAFIEIRDKLALILIIYLILHVIKRNKWFLTAYANLKSSNLKSFENL